MASATRILELAGNQRLASVEYGDPAGEAVFFCHGWPGSRCQAQRLDGAAREFGFRLISFDRPGIALSSRPPERTLRDWPGLLEEAAAQLHVDKFRIVGVSGGGPYALVTAWSMPDRVHAAVTVCGAPPISELADAGQLMLAYRALLLMHGTSPEAVRWLFRLMRPLARMPLPRPVRPMVLRFLGKADAETLADPVLFEHVYETFREAWLGSADGVFDDARVYSQPWGFRIEEIKVPVQVWHGREDANFAWPLAEALAARIPGSQVEILEEEGHYSLPFRQARRILGSLRALQPVLAGGE